MKFNRTFFSWMVLGSILFSLGPASVRSAEPVSIKSLLDEMADRDAIVRWPDPTYKRLQASSINGHTGRLRKPGWFKNETMHQSLMAEEIDGRKEYVILDTPGPGAIVGFTDAAPDPSTVVRIYLDQSPTPVIEENLRFFLGGVAQTEQENQFYRKHTYPESPSEDRFLGGAGTLPPPFAGVQSIGCTMNFPIPFATHCKITTDRRGKSFFSISHRAYPPDTDVRTFTTAEMKTQVDWMRYTGDFLLKPHQTMKTLKSLPSLSRTLEAGASLVAEPDDGPAALCRFSLKLKAENIEQALRSTVLKISFDGKETVWSPVGDFFGTGPGVRPNKAWSHAVEKDGTMQSFWVMPYKRTCKIEVANQGKQAVEVALKDLAIGAWAWDTRTMYFHAAWRRSPPQPKRELIDWTIIDINGQGVFAGETFTIYSTGKKWWGEGDEKVYVDGDTLQVENGTEDYYGYTRGKKDHLFFESPFLVHAQIEGDKGRGFSSMTRIRGLASIPFSSSFKLDKTVWYQEGADQSYAATTYWYALPSSSLMTNYKPSLD